MNEETEKLERLVLDLKLDRKFKILKNEEMCGCWSEANSYDYETEWNLII